MKQNQFQDSRAIEDACLNKRHDQCVNVRMDNERKKN